MAGKLHPPYIDGKVPAFSGTVLKVPFRHNRAVSGADYEKSQKHISCKMMTTSTNEWVVTMTTDTIGLDEKTGMWYAEFDLTQTNKLTNKTFFESLEEGLFYKIQIAYIDNNDQVGYYSDVGVTKYTTTPDVEIEGLKKSGMNIDRTEYIGYYSQQGRDIAEKEYSYCFTVYDEAGNVFYTSGEQIHNSATDVQPYESSDKFYCNKVLKVNKEYKIQYKVTTINGLEVYSPAYRIRRKDTVRPVIDAELHAELNFDEGYIHVYLTDNQPEQGTSGSFKISRTSSKDNYETWDEMCTFSLKNESSSKDLFKDFTIEQGVQYQYSIQQFNSKGLHSNRILSDPVMADFEDMFLYDGERQLKVRFNPNVQSFKNDILESKTDTIGGRYPFIFRNGNVKYKEFSISGLISYLMDEQQLFLLHDDLGPMEFRDTNLTQENMRAERNFKLEVLEWLNNGEAKLFRSPTEGNYLVRLLNVSLAPNAPTGRMLHTFTATAYEIGEVDFQKLKNLGMFKTLNLESSVMQFITLPATDVESIFPYGQKPTTAQLEALQMNTLEEHRLTHRRNTYLTKIDGMSPGSIVAVRYSNSTTSKLEFVEIGDTSVYIIDTPEDTVYDIFGVYANNGTGHFDGMLTYGYYAIYATDNFNYISNFDEEMDMAQFIGPSDNIVETIEDIRTSITNFYHIKILNRTIQEVYIKPDDNDIYRMYVKDDQLNDVPLWEREIMPFIVYKDLNQEPYRYYDGRDIIKKMYDPDRYREAGNTRHVDFDDVYYLGWTDEDIQREKMYFFYFNHPDNNVNLETIGRYVFTNMENISKFAIGKMLIADCLFQKTIISYSVEELPLKYPELAEAYSLWRAEKQDYFDIIEDTENYLETNQSSIYYKLPTEEYLTALQSNSGWMKQAVDNNLYTSYINFLKQAIEQEEQQGG